MVKVVVHHQWCKITAFSLIRSSQLLGHDVIMGLQTELGNASSYLYQVPIFNLFCLIFRNQLLFSFDPSVIRFQWVRVSFTFETLLFWSPKLEWLTVRDKRQAPNVNIRTTWDRASQKKLGKCLCPRRGFNKLEEKYSQLLS